MIRNSQWTLRVEGKATVRISASVSRSGNVATIVLTDVETNRQQVSEHPIFAERAVYTKRVLFVTVGGSADPTYNGHARTIIGAVEDFASKRASDFARQAVR